ncbi:MAG: prepilin-type cleavage/methylation domain-containing protein [Acaryochloridaceae cyanobacterium SU_2_1]|nr:prepilin-type cleavage/methylation domain-containing protein [Acaryochloridaceae cyanobacterium SU_2_1]
MSNRLKHPSPSRRIDSPVDLFLLPTGFTLPELLLGLGLATAVIALAGTALIDLLNRSKPLTVENEQQIELNRALVFMADDVKEALSVSATVPPRAGYTGVFQLLKKDPANLDVVVDYYIASKTASRVWQGPRIVYRRQTNADGSVEMYALVDAIASTLPTCANPGGLGVGTQGLKVFIQNSAYVKICLAGQLPEGQTLSLDTQAFTRGGS